MCDRDLKILSPGHPEPLGCRLCYDGINFALFAPYAHSVSLLLFDHSYQLMQKIPLTPPFHKTGSLWHLLLSKTPCPYYLYEIDEKHLVLDPYATELSSGIHWGQRHNPLKNPGTPYLPLCVIPSPSSFDWQGVSPPRLPLSHLCLYEMHVRSFTQDPSSKTASPGNFLGVIEKIPYLKELGVNAIEMLPVFEFNECEYHMCLTDHKEVLYNAWGYSPISFFAPCSRYATDPHPGAVVSEFKTMVRELHRHGIEVILDVVYNHTAEGGPDGPNYNFRTLAPEVYYQQDSAGRYLNSSGCGNTVNGNHPVTLQMILASLRHWVSEFHVDGFRFDLASILTRGSQGEVLRVPPLVEAITKDPLLADIKLIAEPWDAGGLWQTGAFPLHGDRWAEWNDCYRDDARRFIRGIPGAKRGFSTRLCGSQDLFDDGRGPQHSINFITAHDGFTLNDLVSYNNKHNLLNGENNRDGSDNNQSWNCGIEGETTDPQILELRERQKRNFLAGLLLSLGVPMLTMGDEYGHSKKGNNNTWCHDSPLNWKQWNLNEQERLLLRFTKELLRFRKQKKIFQKETFLTNEDITWHGTTPNYPHWDAGDLFIACTLYDPEGEDLYLAFNMSKLDKTAILPDAPSDRKWHSWIDTAAMPPAEIYDNPAEHPWEEETVKIASHAVVAKVLLYTQ